MGIAYGDFNLGDLKAMHKWQSCKSKYGNWKCEHHFPHRKQIQTT